MPRTFQTRSREALFERADVGAFHLRNRIIMAPLTRNRAGGGLAPSALAAEYYHQRASAGLIIAEATQISAQAQGYADTPGCYTEAQIVEWRKVTDAVHAEGGTIVVQLWHTGRMSHISFHGGQPPVGPSAIRANAKTFIGPEGLSPEGPNTAGSNTAGFVDCSLPRALELDEIPGIIADFRKASLHAMNAGFDGVELHGAHGYLLDAFLRDGTNHRTDAYGGSIANRARLLVEVAQACATAIGADRLGVRISPVSTAGDSHDSNPQPLFEHVVDRLNPLGLAYVHVVEGDTGGARDNLPFDYVGLRERFDGVWMVNNGYDRAMAIDAVASGRADLVSFGRAFLANPDLVARLAQNAVLNPMMDASTIYGGGAHGYTDYPTLGRARIVASLVETSPA